MHPFPHQYTVSVAAPPAGPVTLSSSGLEPLASDAPKEFDGPGDRWSPETLLTAALADCFVLSFRAVARASKFDWTALEARVDATLDRVDRVTQFTRFVTHARLSVPAGTDVERARKLLEKSEQVCLITNSLKGERHLETEVVVA
ncbi:MAG: OsmC family protein [Steroidobacteraceae bacterium]